MRSSWRSSTPVGAPHADAAVTALAHRAAALVAAGVLAVAACSSASPDAGGTGTTTNPTTIDGVGVTDPAAGSGPTTVASSGGGVSTIEVGGTASPPTTTAASGGATPSTPPAPSAPAPGAVGAFAPWYLRPSGPSRITVDVRSQAGVAPRPATLDHLRSVLARISGKPVDVANAALPGGTRQWTADAIRALAPSTTTTGAAVLHLYFLSGGYAGNDQVLGISVRSDVAAVFPDRVDGAAGLFVDAGSIENAVTTHEAGHLLGLVDLFLSTGRADPDHPGHSSNPGSVMYYAVESTLVASILGGGPPTEFDAADLADLAAIRNG